MQVERQSLVDENHALLERVEALTLRSRRLESSEKQAKAELATANAALLEAQEAEKALRRVRSTLEAKTANLTEKCQRLETELDETKLSKQALAVELRSRKRAEREAANADPAEEIRTLRGQCEALTELTRRLESSEIEARAQLVEAKAALREAVESEKSIRRDRSTLETKSASLEEACHRLEAELGEMRLSRHALAVELRSRKRSERDAVKAAEEGRAGFDQLGQEISHRDRMIESLRLKMSTVEQGLHDRDLQLEGLRLDLQCRTEELARAMEALAVFEPRLPEGDSVLYETSSSAPDVAPGSPHAPKRIDACDSDVDRTQIVAPAKDSVADRQCEPIVAAVEGSIVEVRGESGVRLPPPVTHRITLPDLTPVPEQTADAYVATEEESGPLDLDLPDQLGGFEPPSEFRGPQEFPEVVDVNRFADAIEDGLPDDFGDLDAGIPNDPIAEDARSVRGESEEPFAEDAVPAKPATSDPVDLLLDLERDLIDDLPDTLGPVDGLLRELTRHERARQVAIELAGKYDLDESAVGLLTRIFAAHWWSSVRQSIENLLQRRATVRELELAFEIRTFWAENPEFSSCFSRAGNPIVRRIALPWLVALEFVRAYEDGYPDIEEMQEYLLETHDVWAERWPLQDSYPSFLLYFKALLDSREEGESLPPPQSGGRIP